MTDESDTPKKLLASARGEFVEKGYMKASLRNICKNAGVTTGALYFFFKDKDDLYGNVVGEPLRQLEHVLTAHFQGEIENAEGLEDSGREDDYEVTEQIIHCLFRYYEEFQLLLQKSQGSSYEGFRDKVVAMVEQHYRSLADKIRRSAGKEPVDDFLIHWMSHSQVDAFVHLLTHCATEKEAMKQLDGIVNYLRGGWFAVVGEE